MASQTLALITILLGTGATIVVVAFIVRALLRGSQQFGDAIIGARLAVADVEGMPALQAEITVDNQNDSAATVFARVRPASPLSALFDVAVSGHTPRTGYRFEALGTLDGRAERVYLVPAVAGRGRAARITVVVSHSGYGTRRYSTTRMAPKESRVTSSARSSSVGRGSHLGDAVLR